MTHWVPIGHQVFKAVVTYRFFSPGIAHYL